MKKLLILFLFIFSISTADAQFVLKKISEHTPKTGTLSGSEQVLTADGTDSPTVTTGQIALLAAGGAITRDFSSTLIFNTNFKTAEYLQSGDITLTLSVSGNVDGVYGTVVIKGDGSSFLSIPNTWNSSTGNIFDNTKTNYIYLQYINGIVNYNIIVGNSGTGGGSSPYVHRSLFTGTNGTLLTSYTPNDGNPWVFDNSSSLEIQSNRASTKTFGSNTVAIAYTELGVTNCTTTVVAKKSTVTEIIQFYVRYTNYNNNIIINIGDGTFAGNCSFNNGVAGSYSSFGTVTGAPSSGIDHTYVIIVSGSTLTLKVDGATVGTGTIPTSQTGSKFGIASGNATTPGNVSFDAVTIMP
jgi:hypothetical protein